MAGVLLPVAVESEAPMQIEFDLELSEEEYAAIAGHLCKSKLTGSDVRRFVVTAVRNAIEDAMFEYETIKRDPSRRVIR
jgi:hypothetical protein